MSSNARDYLGTLASKKLANTGVTEDHLRSLRPGTHRLLLVEVAVDEVTDTQAGPKKVKLLAGLVEMVPKEKEDTVREFMRAITDSRGGDQALPGTTSTLEDAERALAAQVDRDDDGHPTGKGIWDGDLDTPLEGAEGQAQVKLPAKGAVKIGSPFSVVQDQDTDLCPEPGCVLPQHDEGDHVAADG